MISIQGLSPTFSNTSRPIFHKRTNYHLNIYVKKQHTSKISENPWTIVPCPWTWFRQPAEIIKTRNRRVKTVQNRSIFIERRAPGFSAGNVCYNDDHGSSWLPWFRHELFIGAPAAVGPSTHVILRQPACSIHM